MIRLATPGQLYVASNYVFIVTVQSCGKNFVLEWGEGPLGERSFFSPQLLP